MACPLVLLPGTLCDHRVFAPVLARLPGVQAIMPESVGAETTRGVAMRLLDTLPDQFALGGFSLGGMVALEMIALAPGRITRLALLDTSARADLPERHQARRAAVEQARQVGVERYVLEHLWPSYVTEGAAPGLRDLIGAMAAAAGPETFRQQSEIAISRADSRPRLAAVMLPVLALCGSDDRLCPPALHREIAEAIPHARLAIVPQAGHFAPLEQPDAVATVLAAWLDAPSPIDPGNRNE